MINLKRAFSFALTDFYRNKGISVSAIFVLTLTSLLVTGIFLTHGVSSYLIDTIQNKIDITAYFKESTSEQDILSVKDEILANAPNTKSIDYVSKEDALSDFLKRHKESEVFSKALIEVGGNPFLPSLNIVTGGNTTQYEKIAEILEGQQFEDIIEKVDFSEKKATIDTIFSITRSVNIVGLLLGLVLVFIAISIVFNTIKLIISTAKEEINTMKIVGASNWFIKAPFVIEGGMFGLIASLVCLLLTVIAVLAITRFISVILPGFSLVSYFFSNFFWILLIQLSVGVGVGVVSSIIVVNRHLKV